MRKKFWAIARQVPPPARFFPETEPKFFFTMLLKRSRNNFRLSIEPSKTYAIGLLAKSYAKSPKMPKTAVKMKARARVRQTKSKTKPKLNKTRRPSMQEKQTPKYIPFAAVAPYDTVHYVHNGPKIASQMEMCKRQKTEEKSGTELQ